MTVTKCHLWLELETKDRLLALLVLSRCLDPSRPELWVAGRLFGALFRRLGPNFLRVKAPKHRLPHFKKKTSLSLGEDVWAYGVGQWFGPVLPGDSVPYQF